MEVAGAGGEPAMVAEEEAATLAPSPMDGGDCEGGGSGSGGGNHGLYLKEFAHKFKMPRLVRIVKGHYLHLGGSSSLPGGGGNGQVCYLTDLKCKENLSEQCS